MAQVGDLSAEELTRSSNILSRPANEFGNDENIERAFAVAAFEHSQLHFNILSSVDPKFLKLSPEDDMIYSTFREFFPDLKVDIINENEMKSEKGKIKWRAFCEQFKNVVKDYNYGTLLRSNCEKDYTEENTIFTTRIQFLAIEIARNREGYNDNIRKNFKIDSSNDT